MNDKKCYICCLNLILGFMLMDEIFMIVKFLIFIEESLYVYFNKGKRI